MLTLDAFKLMCVELDIVIVTEYKLTYVWHKRTPTYMYHAVLRRLD